MSGALAILMAWSLAVFLMRSAVRDRLTTLFSIVLIVEGLVLITASSGLVMLLNLEVSRSYYVPHTIADCVMLPVYPLFLAHALPQQFLRALRSQIYVGSTLLYIPIVTYGILSVRLLNIQLQVRKGVKRGTMVGIFVAIFFLICEGSASFLSAQLGTVAGLLGAALIVFLASPLHRLADWF